MAIFSAMKTNVHRRGTKSGLLCVSPTEKLRETLWAHDVHAMKLPCASCHTLHPAQDKMSGIAKKDQVKLCVDCHGEQQKRKANLQPPHIYAPQQKDKQ